MKTDYRDLLKPEILHSIKGLELISRVIVDGYLSGLNHSTRVGAGMEFSQYRSYEPGDDLRLLDWKMLARSGRYYIKQSEIETNISVKFIIDASKSLLHQEEGLTKMDYIRVLVASVAYLAQHQGDAIGLYALNDHDFYSVYPRVEKQHFNRFLHQLVEIDNKGKWPENLSSTENLHDRRHKELIFVVSDMYQHNDELTNFIDRLKTKRNEVVVLHITSPKEETLDYSGSVTFEDLETGDKMKLDASEVRKQYQSKFQNHISRLQSEMLENGIGYEVFNTANHIGEALEIFFQKRKMLL
ncbi:DUF58 domain-containing protein [Fulvivirga sp. RKSG066]|uniref:DUF58 domain-containing protein n=1 Tax=Fulvivirga aurantia TaxID=2529383 RepID=UPI0012BB82D0|nr:DUF58 domain-containing protein [Fulvivirga aurantia]MTI23058.1 DUF58 domain-containing protein [Fulvivirga aurantia]